MKSIINVELEVIQPDWDKVLEFIKQHIDCETPIELWFHSVPQCEGKLKLYLQMYCDTCLHKHIPYKLTEKPQ